MRFHSTPESVLNGEITILGIIECIVSIALYLGICLYLGSFRYLAWPVVVAPLMLFRTERSAQWGVAWYGRFLNWYRWLYFTANSNKVVVIFLFIFLLVPVALCVVALVGSLIRIISPVYWLLRRPMEALREAPSNWQRQCLCIDFFYPPEVVPLENTLSLDRVPSFLRVRKYIFKSGRGATVTMLIIAIMSPLLVLGFLPPLIYRITFKATAIAYLPFIWVVHWTLIKTLCLKTRLERITKGELEKVRRVASWPILAALISKIALIYGWIDLTFLATRFPNQKIMEYFVVPSHWPWWQLTLVLDAVLTFLLFFFADAALSRLEGEGTWSGETVLKTISVTSFVRAMCGLLTMSHFFYIASISVVPHTLKHVFPYL